MENNSVILDDWQKEALAYDGDILLCTGRRVGKTYIMAVKAVEAMRKKKGTKIVVVSLTEDQAQLIIAMALNYADSKYRAMIGKGRLKPTQNKLYFNGGLMQARPVGQTGDAVRGFTGDILIIDEAARMPKMMWIAARPILITSGHSQIWMCSTPFGKNGYFWEKFDEAENKKDPAARFKVFYKSSEDVFRDRPISDSWTQEQRDNALKGLEQERKDMTELEYGQEFLGLFLEDLNQFFPDELIDKCCILEKQPTSEENKKYMGCDLARMGGDQNTWEIVEKANDKYYHREAIAKTKMFMPEVVRDIIFLTKTWGIWRVGIDAGAGSLGVSVLDFLLESDIKRKVVALNNRDVDLDVDGEKSQNMLKEDMYFKLKALMESDRVQLLKDEEVILSLRSVQMEFIKTASGRTRMRVFGKFTHHVEGIVRAIWLADKDRTLDLWCR